MTQPEAAGLPIGHLAIVARTLLPVPRVVITGGAGFLGSHLCERFLREGYDVSCLDNFLTGAASNVEHLIGESPFHMVRCDVSEFIDAITRVAQGGTVLDPEVVRQLLSAGRRGDTLAALTLREREVLSLIAQGRSNAAIAGTLFISPKVVEKHVASIFDKLGLPPSDSDNRRVIAAIRYLES